MGTSLSEIKDWGKPFRYEGSTSKALLLIHGFTGSTHQLRALGEQLTMKEGWTTLGVRLPGHGTSVEDLAQKKWPDWYSTVRLALEELKQDHRTVAILGFSLGGVLAFYLAAKKRDVVAGVIGICPALHLRGIGHRFVPIIKHLKKTINKGDPDPNDPWRGYHVVPLETMHEVLKFQKVARKQLSEVKAPILVIQARQDKRIPRKVGQEIAQKVSSSRFEHFWAENSGHIVVFSPSASAVTERISKFLRTL
ncbi:MAG: alpha/beta hydrolase [Candidatus Hodarchaeota archaeon]